MLKKSAVHVMARNNFNYDRNCAVIRLSESANFSDKMVEKSR